MKVVYHGSAEKFDTVEPRHNRRGGHQLIWDRKSFHATPHRWIALAYTRAKRAIETTGVDLYELKPVVTIIGPTTLEDALKNLYGQGGYIYEFDAADFSHEEGLGNLEVFIDKSVSPIRIERVEDPVAEMLEAGITFEFRQESDPKGGRSKWHVTKS